MNTERTEKFVNAIACDLEEGGFRQVSGTMLRRTLATAVSAALPLLAEQQVAELPPLPRTQEFTNLYGVTRAFSAEQMQEYARAALAATGKQQVGEVQGDACFDNQMGSPAFEVWAQANDYSLHRDPGSLNYTGDTLHAWLAWRHLAARQPGVQQPIAWGVRYKRTGLFLDLVVRTTAAAERVEASAGFSNNKEIVPFYAGPPAQGVDLHRLVPPEWISEQLGGPLDDLTPGQAWRQGFNQCRARALLLVEQAMGFPAEQQRDAASGVGNG